MKLDTQKSHMTQAAIHGVGMAIIATAILVGPVHAQEPIVYPSKGQSQKQMEQDKYSCYQWARG